MPNINADIFPKILGQALDVLTSELPILQSVNTEYSEDAKQQGDIVWVPYTNRMVATDVVPGHIPNDQQDTKDSTAPIPLEFWKKSDFTLTEREIRSIMNGIIVKKVEEAAQAIRDAIALEFWRAAYRDSFLSVGTAGTTPFNATDKLATSAEARRLLNQQRAPRSNRVMLLESSAESNATILPEFSNWYQSGNTETIEMGRLGMKQGFNWLYDDSVGQHVAGTLSPKTAWALASATPTVTTVTNPLLPNMNPKSVYSIGMTNTGASGAVKRGDLFRVAGDSQTYVVTADQAVASSTSLVVQFSPAPRVTWSNGAAVTFLASHMASLALHRNAVGAAFAPVKDPVEGLSQNQRRETMIDPIYGLPLTIDYFEGYHQDRWEISCMFGARALRPEHIIRVLG
jgi:hypothetical protein